MTIRRHQRWQKNNYESSRHLDDDVWRIKNRGPTPEEVAEQCYPWKSKGLTKSQWEQQQHRVPTTVAAPEFNVVSRAIA